MISGEYPEEEEDVVVEVGLQRRNKESDLGEVGELRGAIDRKAPGPKHDGCAGSDPCYIEVLVHSILMT